MDLNDNRFGDRQRGGNFAAALIASLVGLVLIFGAIHLQYWNEGRAIKDSQSLKSGASQVEIIDPSKVSAANEGKVVYLNGVINTQKQLEDQDFQIKIKALKLLRNTWMYQWTEDSNTNSSGNRRSDYTYSKQWRDSLVDTLSFHNSTGHANPDRFPFPAYRRYADDAQMGAFAIAPEVLKELDYDQPFSLSPGQNLKDLPASQKGKITLAGDAFYLGENQAAPAIGDEKVAFAYAPSDLEYSLVGVQSDHTIKAFMGGGGTRFKMMKVGKVGADVLFSKAIKTNDLTTWGYRALSVLMMFIGFLLLWAPISFVLNLIPFIGSLAEIGLVAVAFGFSATLSLTVIGLSWLIVRPVIGGSMLAAALLFFVCTLLKRNSGERQPDVR